MRRFLERTSQETLATYEIKRSYLKEHFGIEETVLAGGYGYRQVLELVQNGADAILEASEAEGGARPAGRISVLLRGRRLYVANTGAPLSEGGLDALLSSHSSSKRGNQIGRFGLGFKSLLRLGGVIDLFGRRSLDFRFDPDRCRSELKERFRVQAVPGLRLAWPLDAGEREADGVLRGLQWAETVVRAEVQSGETLNHLRQEVRGFPGEFLLFFPASATLLLDDGETPEREISVQRQGDLQVLRDGERVSHWRVVTCEARIPEAAALTDATDLHSRESVPVSWAIPLEGKREESGRFWAFFPTQTQTYLPGILNAPWKLNSDRNAVIGGEWNAALMREAAGLIVNSIRELATTEDPGRPLDAFPRQCDRKDDPAEPLLQCVWNGLQATAVVSNGDGVLRHGSELWSHPLDSEGVAKAWKQLASPNERRILTHPRCLAGHRASRLRALADRLQANQESSAALPCLQRRDVADWFAAAGSVDLGVVPAILRLASDFSQDSRPGDWEVARTRITIIPTEAGTLARAPEVVLAPEGVELSGRSLVATGLARNPEVATILRNVLRVRELDDEVWREILASALDRAGQQGDTQQGAWESFWRILRSAPLGAGLALLEWNRYRVRVRRRDGAWARASEALLPGRLVGAEDEANRGLLVDSQMHRDDQAMLARLGVHDSPEGLITVGAYPYSLGVEDPLDRWVDSCRHLYKQKFSNSASWGYLEPSAFAMPSGYALLPLLKSAANARLTELFLGLLANPELTRPVEVRHATVSAYPTLHVPHPLAEWLLGQYGCLLLGRRVVPLRSWLSKLNEPVLAEIPEAASRTQELKSLFKAEVGAKPPPSELTSFWVALVEAVADPKALASGSLSPMLSRAAKDGFIPRSLRIEGREIPLSEISVSTSPDLCERLHRRGLLVVALEGPTLELWRQAGARDLGSVARAIWREAEGPRLALTEVIPELGSVLNPDSLERAKCQQVSDLRLSIDGHEEAAPCLLWDGTLFVDGARFAALSRANRLLRSIQEVAAAGWLKCSLEEALERLWNGKVEERRLLVAQGASAPERLAIAVGGRRDPLLEALGEVAELSAVERCSLAELAKLTLAQLGPATLLCLQETLEAEGLKPPRRLNSPEGRRFVASIGFPEEYAAAPKKKSAPELYVTGPIDLPPLHDFQEEVLAGVSELVRAGVARRRAVVSLPTGGGKTRVTVEAAVRLVLAPQGVRRSVVWVAQTEELCEQAVQAFRQVWVNLGAHGTDLRIVRLWGGNLSPATQAGTGPVVVVASIQTLNSRLRTGELDWLKEPGLVVVDECHHAITPSYTNLLRWLDAESPKRAEGHAPEPPILGLSATPFRMDDEESQRLARRFDQTWFPADQEVLHERLLRQGVLAKAQYEVLETGAVLTDEEMRRLQSLPEPWEGLDFENLLEAINQRLARDPDRNERLVRCILSSSEGSILLFSNSVQHAEEMSARLNLTGVAAAAVSGETLGVSRRYFLDRFKSGEIRVLCNHSVLTTGFDAPKTDMILIARQVFSPVRYMQMVGRGLRGEMNGGTQSCRIVTALDNLGRFASKHPYHYCKDYFTRLGAGAPGKPRPGVPPDDSNGNWR